MFYLFVLKCHSSFDIHNREFILKTSFLCRFYTAILLSTRSKCFSCQLFNLLMSCLWKKNSKMQALFEKSWKKQIKMMIDSRAVTVRILSVPFFIRRDNEICKNLTCMRHWDAIQYKTFPHDHIFLSQKLKSLYPAHNNKNRRMTLIFYTSKKYSFMFHRKW